MKCPKGSTKRRTAKGRGHPSSFKHSLRGHTWQKLFKDVLNSNGEKIGEIKIGRKCTKCGKKHLIPELSR